MPTYDKVLLQRFYENQTNFSIQYVLYMPSFKHGFATAFQESVSTTSLKNISAIFAISFFEHVFNRYLPPDHMPCINGVILLGVITSFGMVAISLLIAFFLDNRFIW